jgi:hypothetical protein
MRLWDYSGRGGAKPCPVHRHWMAWHDGWIDPEDDLSDGTITAGKTRFRKQLFPG